MDERYLASGPDPVDNPPTTLIENLKKTAGESGIVFAGFDFPIGIPRHFAERAGISRFRDFLLLLGTGDWKNFYSVCNEPKDISVHRPFYPNQSIGEHERQHLLDALDAEAMLDLLRVCERGGVGQRQAASLFWTLGGNQVGKAALNGWRHVLVPALKNDFVRLWPFDGNIESLLRPGLTIIAETYPAECYGWFPDAPTVSKRDINSRIEFGSHLLVWADANGVVIEPRLKTSIEGRVSNRSRRCVRCRCRTIRDASSLPRPTQFRRTGGRNDSKRRGMDSRSHVTTNRGSPDAVFRKYRPRTQGLDSMGVRERRGSHVHPHNRRGRVHRGLASLCPLAFSLTEIDAGDADSDMKRDASDESYVIDLCDRFLNLRAIRQHRFDFLLGDTGKNGNRAKLPVDAYYEELGVVIEYWESQHEHPAPFWDRKITCSGCTRGEQRRMYDRRKREVLEQNGIRLAVLKFEELCHNTQGRLKRLAEQDIEAVSNALRMYARPPE